MAEGGQDDHSDRPKHSSTPYTTKTKSIPFQSESDDDALTSGVHDIYTSSDTEADANKSESDNDASTSRVDFTDISCSRSGVTDMSTSFRALGLTSNICDLTSSDIHAIWYGRCTILKYESGMNDKRTDVIRNYESGKNDTRTDVIRNCETNHAEINLLNRIFKKALLKLLKVGNPKELKTLSEQLKTLLSDVDTKYLPLLEEEITEQRTQLEEHERTQLELREKIQGRKKDLDESSTRRKKDETLQELKIYQKKKSIFKKLQPEVKGVLEHLERQAELNEKKIKELPHHLPKIAVLQEYVSLPQEFWVSRSPCKDCAEALIEAYRYYSCDNKPIIHVAYIYNGNDTGPLLTLKDKFNFKLWDLMKEYETYKTEFEGSANFLNYRYKRETTRENLRKENLI